MCAAPSGFLHGFWGSDEAVRFARRVFSPSEPCSPFRGSGDLISRYCAALFCFVSFCDKVSHSQVGHEQVEAVDDLECLGFLIPGVLNLGPSVRQAGILPAELHC